MVSDSLALAGYVPDADVALVETLPPSWSPSSVVVCQNAWNFLPRREYVRLIGEYAPRRRALYAARRATAGLNTRRAGVNVVLSAYMHDLLSALGRRTLLAPVTLPWDLCTPDDVAAAGRGDLALPGLPDLRERPYVLVPGTLTWYKTPGEALDLAARLPEAERPLVVFAGTDDGSGCMAHVRRRAEDVGVDAWIGPADRPAMKWLLANAALTLVPSRLESLSLSMSEALLLSPRVAATAIPVHREVAERMGRTPVWLPDDPNDVDLADLLASPDDRRRVDLDHFRRQWTDLARQLANSGGVT